MWHSSRDVVGIHKTPGRGISGTRLPEFIQATVILMYLFWRNQFDCAERVETKLTNFISDTFPEVLVSKSVVLIAKLRGIC
jgi:hypothetical protein